MGFAYFKSSRRAGERRGNAHIANLNRIQRDFCKCGLPKFPKHLTCLLCWKATPYQVRLGLKSHDIEVRRASMRKILEVARERASAAQSTPDAQTIS